MFGLLFKRSSLVSLATICTAGQQWFILALVGRIGGPDLLGEYALAQAVAVPVTMLAWLSLRPQITINASGLVEDFWFLRLIVPAIAFVLVAAASAVLNPAFGFTGLLTVLFAGKYIEGLFDLSNAFQQRVGDFARYARTTIVRCVVASMVFWFDYRLTGHLIEALSLQAAVTLGMFLALEFRLVPKAAFSSIFTVTRRAWRRRAGIVAHVLPFALTALVTQLNWGMPRYLIAHFLGSRDVGVLASVTNLVGVGGLVVSSISIAALPTLAEAVARSDPKRFMAQLALPLTLALLLSIAGALISQVAGAQVLALVYGDKFSGEGQLLVWASLAIGPAFCSVIVAAGCYAAQLRRLGFLLQVLTLAVMAGVIFATAGSIGVYSALLATAISGSFQTVAGGSALWWSWRRSESRPAFAH